MEPLNVTTASATPQCPEVLLKMCDCKSVCVCVVILVIDNAVRVGHIVELKVSVLHLHRQLDVHLNLLCCVLGEIQPS